MENLNRLYDTIDGINAEIKQIHIDLENIKGKISGIIIAASLLLPLLIGLAVYIYQADMANIENNIFDLKHPETTITRKHNNLFPAISDGGTT